jgi:hypothetical protein
MIILGFLAGCATAEAEDANKKIIHPAIKPFWSFEIIVLFII